jgi:hypothetical protein
MGMIGASPTSETKVKIIYPHSPQPRNRENIA